VLLVVALGLFAWKFMEKTQEVRRLGQQESALRYENQQTAAENRRILAAIKYYRTPRYVEGQARALLGYTFPGEISVQVKPQRAQPIMRRAPALPPATPAPVWHQWWSSFSP